MVCIAPNALKIIRIEYIVKYNCPVGLKCSDTDSTKGFAVLWKGNNTVKYLSVRGANELVINNIIPEIPIITINIINILTCLGVFLRNLSVLFKFWFIFSLFSFERIFIIFATIKKSKLLIYKNPTGPKINVKPGLGNIAVIMNVKDIIIIPLCINLS